jgi:hypothetical protein
MRAEEGPELGTSFIPGEGPLFRSNIQHIYFHPINSEPTDERRQESVSFIRTHLRLTASQLYFITIVRFVIKPNTLIQLSTLYVSLQFKIYHHPVYT